MTPSESEGLAVRAGAARPPAPIAFAFGAARMLVVPGTVLLVWYILSLTIFVVPAPGRTVQVLVSELGTASYVANCIATLEKLLLAFGIAAVLGIALGSLLGLVQPLRAALEPLILTLNGIPKIVFYPILLTIFGLSGASQVTMGVIFGALPVLVNVMAGITEMPPIYRKLARTLEVPRRTALFRVYLRSAVPKVMVALQLGFALSTLGVVYGELIASTNGIGQTLIQAYGAGSYPLMSSAILVIVGFALAGFGVLKLLERAIVREH